MILVDAVYIHTGGSKVLFDFFTNELSKRNLLNNYYFLIDRRLEKNLIVKINHDNYKILNGNESERILFYKKNSHKFTRFFCMANVPPPIHIKSNYVFILFHNAHIIQPNLELKNISIYIIYKLKWLYILYKNIRTYNWIVQTNSMFNLVKNGLFINDTKILILPFFNDKIYSNKVYERYSNDKTFAYIADGQPQKNHLFLLKVWKILYDKYNLNLKLTLTVSNAYPQLLLKIKELKEAGLNIENQGSIPHSNVLNLYSTIDYLIYPSLIESFGLPLIEAVLSSCDILAIDKKYVTDVVKPSKSFSENSVKELVKIIIDINNGITFPKTQIVVQNRINDFINLIA